MPPIPYTPTMLTGGYTKYGMSTSFVRKGRTTKDEALRKVLRSELSRERATRLEGSFRMQKRHYLPFTEFFEK